MVDYRNIYKYMRLIGSYGRLTEFSLIIHQISLMLTGWVVPGIVPLPGTQPCPTPGTPATAPGLATGACSGSVRLSEEAVGL